MADNYVYHNINPENLKISDCVCRAISLALDMDYYDVEDLLVEIGDYYYCEELCVCCYSYLLEDMLGIPAHDGCGKKVEEIISQYPDDILLIRIDGHLTCSIDGKIHDIWDCTDKICDRYWIIERE